jgi:hypothetical protein
MANLEHRTLTVNCPKCGALIAHLHLTEDITPAQLEAYRGFVLNFHDDASHRPASVLFSIGGRK